MCVRTGKTMSPSSGNQRTSGLGRGLGALITAPAASIPATGPLEIAVESIEPNPYQPRATIDQGKLHTLAESIRQHGIIQPLVVREIEPGRFFLIAGEPRWRSAQPTGLTTATAFLKNASPRSPPDLPL